jgi:hypothetical protein
LIIARAFADACVISASDGGEDVPFTFQLRQDLLHRATWDKLDEGEIDNHHPQKGGDDQQ